jgi:hypothetical protein
MSYNDSSYEQSSVMRAAIEMVMRVSQNGDKQRDEVIKVVLKIADEGDHDANALANLAITAMSEPQRRTA